MMSKAPPGKGEVGGGRARGRPGGWGRNEEVAGNGRQAVALLESRMRLDPPWSPLRGGMVGVDVGWEGSGT